MMDWHLNRLALLLERLAVALERETKKKANLDGALYSYLVHRPWCMKLKTAVCMPCDCGLDGALNK